MVLLICLCRGVCERVLGPCALLCTLWVVHILQQNRQRKCQHLHFWLPINSHCKPLLPVSSHLPELKSRLLTYSRLPQNKYSGRFLPKSVQQSETGAGEGRRFASCNANSPPGSLRLSHFSLILIRNGKFGGLALAFSKVMKCGCRWDGGKSGIKAL